MVTSASWVVRPAPGDDEFDAVYMPFTTTHQLLNLTKLNDITVTSASTGEVSVVSKRIGELLRQRHGITAEKPDDFTISTQATRAIATGGLPPNVAAAIAGNVKELERVTLEQLAGTLERASGTMRWLLAAVAAVSLLVGGIGIMNITLLSVTERTKEIGLRMAVGARGRDVTRQFLTEAVAISLAGGAVGVVLGLVASYLISSTLRWATVVSPSAVLIAFGVSAAVGRALRVVPGPPRCRARPHRRPASRIGTGRRVPIPRRQRPDRLEGAGPQSSPLGADDARRRHRRGRGDRHGRARQRRPRLGRAHAQDRPARASCR